MNHTIIAMPVPEEGEPGGTPPQGPGGLSQLFLPLIIILFFFMLMPLFNKKEKQRKARIGELKKHDRIVTTGGIYGTVVSLDENALTVEIAKDVRIKIKRSSVFDLEHPGEAQAAAQRKAEAKA